MKIVTNEELREQYKKIPEIQRKRNGVSYPAHLGVTTYKIRFSKPSNYKKEAEDAIKRGLIKYDLKEIEGTRKITETEEKYTLEIMVNKQIES